MTEPTSRWQDLRQRIRHFNKTASESSNFHLPHYFKFSDFNETEKLYFLGVPNGQTNFTLIYTEFPRNEYFDIGASKRPECLAWRQCWSSDAQPKSNKPLTREQELLRERMRVRTSGIMSYSMTEHFSSNNANKFNQMLFFSGSQLHVFRDDNAQEESFPKELTMKSEGCILNPATCPNNPDLICFIQDGDLHVKHCESEDVRLTYLRNDADSTQKNCTSAGMPSYVVQEEFDRYVGCWWRPASNATAGNLPTTYQILYEIVDESEVDVLNIVSYANLGSSVDQYRYPRPGTKNAVSNLRIVEFTCFDGQIANIKHLPLEKALYDLFHDMEYLLNAGWMPDGSSVYVEMTNRLQSVKQLFLIPLSKFSDRFQSALTEPMETNESEKPCYLLKKEEDFEYWIHTNELLHFLPSTDTNVVSFIAGSEVSGFLHIHHYTVDLSRSTPYAIYEGVNRDDRSSEVPLTSGEWEVADKHLWVDAASKLVFFVGYKDTPLEAHLYATSYDHPQSISNPIRLTAPGFSHSVEMDKNCRYFVTTFSSTSSPHASDVHSVSIFPTHAGEGVSIKTEKIGTLLIPVSTKPTSTAELFEFENSCDTKLYGVVFRPNPTEASASNGGKHPVVLNIYGGPHVQCVTNSYTVNRHLFSHALAHFGYAVIIIDGRGSARRGVKFEGHLKKRLGNVEIGDQVETLQWLARKFEFLDLSRTAIMGWSYGGYLSLMGLASRPDFFKVAIAGAPVTNWMLYDTAYTERFLGYPCENLEAYAKSSVLELASHFPDDEGRLLIIHGLMDENVHFYHTSALVEALVKASKPYVLQTYPRERHGIRSLESHEHYAAVVMNFLMKNL